MYIQMCDIEITCNAEIDNYFNPRNIENFT